MGKRAWQQEPEGQRRNLWCGEQLCQVTDASDTVMHRYYEEGERVGGHAYLVGRDHLGSVVREFEAGTGALRAEHWYSANGKRESQCHGAGCPGVSQGWAGQYRHERTELQLATYRVYDPGSARWLSRDPIGEAGGINLYAYVEGNPLGFVDPGGLKGASGGWGGQGRQRPRSSTPIAISIGAGGVGNWMPIMGAAESGVAIDSTGGVCFYSQVCYGVGINDLAGGVLGIAGGIQKGALKSGTQECDGIYWSGGKGLAGEGQITIGADGTQVQRGLVGVGSMAGAGGLRCQVTYECLNR